MRTVNGVLDSTLLTNHRCSPVHHRRSRKREVAALSGPNEFAEFYRRLADITKYYKAVCISSTYT